MTTELVLLLWLCAAAHAHADNGEFERGMQALRAGDQRAAASAFAAAHRADGNPLALLNLGIVCTNLGQLTEALEALEGYVREADSTRDAQTIAAVRAELARLRSSNAVITLHTLPADASVEVDGVPIAAGTRELVLLPGQRHFMARAPGYADHAQALQVPAGSFTLELRLRRLHADSQTPAARAAAAVQPTAAAAASTQPQEQPGSVAAQAGCLLGGVCLGPVLSLGLPNLFGVGGHLRIGPYFGAALDYQALPTLHLSGVAAGASLLTAEGRIYPFGGSFFLAGGFGYQRVVGRASKDQIAIQAEVDVPTFKVGIGFMGHDGFVAGIDLGLLFPLAGTDIRLRMTAPAPAGILQSQLDANVARLQQDARSGVRQVLHMLPFLAQLNVLRIGYLF